MRERARIPRCFVCEKPVEGFMRVATRTADDVVEFTALCHGQRDVVRVPREYFQSHELTIEYGEAFRPAGLLTEASPRGE